MTSDIETVTAITVLAAGAYVLVKTDGTGPNHGYMWPAEDDVTVVSRARWPMPDHRTPEEQDEQAAHIRNVLTDAVRTGASLRMAVILGLPQDAIDRWGRQLWDGLRAGLDEDGDPLAAILLLLDGRIDDECRAQLSAVPGVADV
jgi:hypothetical protein